MVQSYHEGVIQTFEDLDAVDEMNVNVDVTREEKVDVITVPVVIVLQDGQGNDVVRVVLTDGTTRQGSRLKLASLREHLSKLRKAFQAMNSSWWRPDEHLRDATSQFPVAKQS